MKFLTVIHPEDYAMSDFNNYSLGNDTESELATVVVTSITAAITIVFMVVGLVGNLLVIAAVARKKSLRTRGNAFIVSLSVVGLLYVGFVLVPGVDTLIHREWRFGDFMCGFHSYYSLAFTFLSLLHTMCIGLDRLVNVVLFTRARQIASRRNVGIAVALCWLATVPVILYHHYFVVDGKMYYLEKALRCIVSYNVNSWNASLAIYCVIFVLPSFVIVGSYAAILSFVRKKRKLLDGNLGPPVASSSRALVTTVSAREALSLEDGIRNKVRDRVTFAPASIIEEGFQTAQRHSSLISCSVDNSGTAHESDKGQSNAVVDGDKHTDQSLGTVSQPSMRKIKDRPTDDLISGQDLSCCSGLQSRDAAVASHFDSNANTLTCANREEHVASNSVPKSKKQTGKKHLAKTMSLAEVRRRSVVYNRSQSLDSDTNKSRKLAPNHSDQPGGRRGSQQPSLSAGRRLSKTLGRGWGRAKAKPSKIRNDRDLNRMMLAVFTVVWVGYLPYPLVRYIDIPTRGIDVSSNVYMVVTLTSYMAGCINPIIYGFMHRRFRAAFIEMLTLGKCKSSNKVGARGRRGSLSVTERSTAGPGPLTDTE